LTLRQSLAVRVTFFYNPVDLIVAVRIFYLGLSLRLHHGFFIVTRGLNVRLELVLMCLNLLRQLLFFFELLCYGVFKFNQEFLSRI
jgi:hypothetical protein